jgi:hypothetical protein
MKAALLCLLIAVFCSQAQAQRIHFTDTSNSWNIYASGGGTEWYRVVLTYKFTGDTIIAGNDYRIMTGTSQNRAITPWISYPPTPARYFFREDTLAGKVWVRRNPFTTDSLVYNGSWALGDTILRKSSDKWYITGVDSTQMAGLWYRVFRVGSARFGLNYFAVVEGIGSTAWPDFIYSGAGGGESNYSLLCFNHGGTTPVMSPILKKTYTHFSGFSNAGPCDVPWTRLSVPEEAGQGNVALLSPDPVTRDSRIRLLYPIKNGVLRIYNVTGQEVSVTIISKDSVIPIPDGLNIPGLYIYRITDLSKGSNFSGRFVVN